jgi:hypothetical protein
MLYQAAQIGTYRKRGKTPGRYQMMSVVTALPCHARESGYPDLSTYSVVCSVALDPRIREDDGLARLRHSAIFHIARRFAPLTIYRRGLVLAGAPV